MDLLAYRELHYDSAPGATAAPSVSRGAGRRASGAPSAREVQQLAAGAETTTAAASWWLDGSA